VLLSKRLAVLRATATNQDGRMITIATPSRLAQVAMYQEASAVYRELKA
jgi:acyl transferase domain-containing protein